MEKTFAIPCPPFTLRLSQWDKRMTPLYSKRVLCFPLPNNSTEHKEYIAHLLFVALQSTVEELPFLAGSVVVFSKDQPWLRDLRPHGAAYLEIKDLAHEINYMTLRNTHFSPSLLDTEQLCPFPEPIYVREGAIDVCRMRANFVEGGLLLVVSIIHTVCDGRGISDVLKLFADKLRKAQAGELASLSTGHEGTPKHTYSSDRASILSGNDFPGVIENHPAWTASPLKSPGGFAGTKTLCTTFHISSDSLRALRLVASSSLLSLSAPAAINTSHRPDSQQTPHFPDQATSISTHDAIAALIWRSIMLARHGAGVLSAGTTTHLSQAVDCRTRLHLPEPFFGNAIYAIKASLALPRLAGGTDSVANASRVPGLQAAARVIRTEIGGATADKFRDLLGFVERTHMEVLTRPSVLEDLSMGSVLLVSYFGFEMHELDFGEALGGEDGGVPAPFSRAYSRDAGGAAAAAGRELRICDQRAGGSHTVVRQGRSVSEICEQTMLSSQSIKPLVLLICILLHMDLGITDLTSRIKSQKTRQKRVVAQHPQCILTPYTPQIAQDPCGKLQSNGRRIAGMVSSYPSKPFLSSAC